MSRLALAFFLFPLSLAAIASGQVESLPRLARPDTTPLWVGSAPGTGPRRCALLVAVDDYSDKELDLPEAKLALDHVRATLTGMGYPEENLALVSGDRATLDTVEGELEQLTRGMQGPGNSLLVYWVGHGFVMGGERHFLTYHSQQDSSASVYDDTIPASRLYEALRRRRDAVKRAGAELDLAIVVDACALSVLGIPTSDPEPLEPVAEIECFSSSNKRCARYRFGEVPYFTKLWCEALASARETRVSLLTSLRTAKTRTDKISSQKPVIPTDPAPGAAPRDIPDIVLADRANVTITVLPLDVTTGLPLAQAEVSLKGRRGERDPITGAVRFAGLIEGRRYELQLGCEGYWPARSTPKVEAANDGRTLRIPLEPSFVLVEGRVRAHADEAVSVEVTGDFGGRAIRGYHELSADLPGGGAYRLILPEITGERGVLILVGDDEVGRQPLAVRSSGTARSPQTIRMPEFVTPAATPTASPDAAPVRAATKPEHGRAPSGALGVLYDRERYAALGEAEARGLAEAAERAWPELFEGMERVRTQRYSCGGKSHFMNVYAHARTGLEFALVPGGSFRMGSTSGADDEEPVHVVSLDPFLMCTTECTQAAWKRVVTRDPSHFGSRSDAHPVENMTWTEAAEWCEGLKLELPTEAQWEYAARAGTESSYCYGANLSSRQARFDQGWDDGPVDVGRYEANGFGLLDVHGNVWEWCRDWYVPYANDVEAGDGQRRGSSSYRVYRGGSFNLTAMYARSADRRLTPTYRDRDLGFRPARSLSF